MNLHSTENDDGFDWGPLGKAKWLELGAFIPNRDNKLRLIRFACARHRNCSRTEAARQAGYKGEGKDDDGLRQAASAAAKTNAVVHLLELAALEDGGGPSPMDAAERKGILEKLARGSDPSIKIKALDALEKLEERQAALGRAPSDDGFSEWRVVRDFLRQPNGGPAILLMATGGGHGMPTLPLLHDVYRAVMRDDPLIWERAASRLSPGSKAALDKHLADPEWQHDARVKVWREIGVEIEDGEQPSPKPKANGSHQPAEQSPERMEAA